MEWSNLYQEQNLKYHTKSIKIHKIPDTLAL